MITAAVIAVLVMVAVAVTSAFHVLFAEDCKRLGLWIARHMIRPIGREQGAMAALDAVFPEAVGLPRTGDYTSWRYVPLVGAWPSMPMVDLGGGRWLIRPDTLTSYWDRE